MSCDVSFSCSLCLSFGFYSCYNCTQPALNVTSMDRRCISDVVVRCIFFPSHTTTCNKKPQLFLYFFSCCSLATIARQFLWLLLEFKVTAPGYCAPVVNQQVLVFVLQLTIDQYSNEEFLDQINLSMLLVIFSNIKIPRQHHTSTTLLSSFKLSTLNIVIINV